MYEALDLRAIIDLWSNCEDLWADIPTAQAKPKRKVGVSKVENRQKGSLAAGMSPFLAIFLIK